jgi:CDP-glucose 4,6-dehydratase
MPDLHSHSVTSSRQALRGKRVFVTGHTGFKGAWLCLWLDGLGARVTGYALSPPTEPNLFTICGIEQLLDRHYEADIRDESRLLAAMRQCEPDVVLHFAAQSVVREGYRSPRETFDVNVMGTASVLECVRKLDRPCTVLAITSDKCYENREQVWGYRECDPMGEKDPYSASKGAAELVINSYRHSFFPPERLEKHGVKLASARAGNVIGGGDFTSDALVVDAITALAKKKPIQVRNPNALRPWNHVLQALSGYLHLVSRMLVSDDLQLSTGWNFGPMPGNELPTREIVGMLIEEWGSGTWVDASDPNQPHESQILRLSIDKAMWELGWRPRWNLRRSLQETVRWYAAYFERNQNMVDLSRSQIELYENADWLNGTAVARIEIPALSPMNLSSKHS